MNEGVMLNVYPDSLGGSMRELCALLEREELRGAFQSLYVLPSMFHSDLDRGFSIISYELNCRLADEDSLNRLRAMGLDLKLDFVLNHLSVLSPQFQDVLDKGDASAYRDFFIDWNRFWEGRGEMTEQGYIQPAPEYLREMFLRKPGLPILMAHFPDGTERPYWNTFYQEVRYPRPLAQDIMRVTGLQYGEAEVLCEQLQQALDEGRAPESVELGEFAPCREAVLAWLNSQKRYLGQLDLNLQSPLVWAFYQNTLERLRGYGASIVRLDAFAYAPKAPGRRNFMNDPEVWEALERLAHMAEELCVTLLPEIHAAYAEDVHGMLAEKGYITYDFFLPGLLIDALEGQDGAMLARWAKEIRARGIRTVNMLGCHDGIPLLDLRGMLPEERIEALIELVVSRGGLVKKLHGKKQMYYQVNATYYSALGEADYKLLLARAIQLFMPGKPQVWYLDLFAGKNDLEAVARHGTAGHKEINRTNLMANQLEEGLKRPVVRQQLKMLRMRNECPAFTREARFEVEADKRHGLRMRWETDSAWAELTADLSTYSFCMRTWNGQQECCVEQHIQ